VVQSKPFPRYSIVMKRALRKLRFFILFLLSSHSIRLNPIFSSTLYLFNQFFNIRFSFPIGNKRVMFTLRKKSSDKYVFAETFSRYFPNDFLSLLKTDSMIFDLDATILDIGAYNGTTSVLFRKSFPSHPIVAIEASPDNFEMLKLNTKSLEKVKIFNLALDSTHGRVVSKATSQGFWGLQTELASEGNFNSVECISIADILSLLPNSDKRFLVKIDIEGGERFLSEQDWTDIASFEVICIEFHDWLFPKEGLSCDFWAALSANRDTFSIFLSDNNIWVIKQ
jgi:FkbM family methyltransferase